MELFLSFLAGVVIGGLIGAMLIYAYELRVLRGFRQRVEAIESKYLAMIGAGEESEEN